jgi:transposase
MPANILHLPSYIVTALEKNDHDYHIDAEVRQAVTHCIHCKASNPQGFGRREQMVKDLPMHGKRVGIYVNTRRYRCRECTKTFYELLPDTDAKRAMTTRLVAWMGKQAVRRTFASIAEEVGCTEFTVRAVFSDYVNELERTIRFETPNWMGIDEIHLIKPRGVITNIQNNTVVELLHDRNKETVIEYLAALQGKETIQYVAMDMWQPYKDAIELMLPKAKIIIDKFHVVKMANEAMEQVRKSYRGSLTPKQRRGLMHDRLVMLKREHDLTDEEALKLSGWLKHYPELGMAYRLKEDFFKIYDAKTKEEALRRFAAWEIAVMPDFRDAFQDLIRAWRNWQPCILAYFDHPVTNAYTESLNNLIGVMNRLGRGYSFEALRAKILFSEGVLKKQTIRPKFERRREPELATRNFEMAYMCLERVVPHQPSVPAREVNFGADISTLTRLIEAGEL